MSLLIFFFASLSVLAAILYFAFGSWALRSAPDAPTRTIFFLLNVAVGLWSLSTAALVAAPSAELALTVYRLAGVTWIPLPSLLLHFLLLVSGERPLRRRPWIGVPVYLPMVAFLLRLPFDSMGVVRFEASPVGWVEVWQGSSAWWNGFVVYGIAYPLIGLGLVAFRAWRSQDPVRWRQALWVVLPGPPVLGLVFLVGWVLPKMGYQDLPETGHLLPLFWLAGFARAIASHRLLSITPAVAGREVLDTMAEAVLVLDPGRRVAMVNRAAADLFGRPRRQLLHGSVSTIFPGEELFAPESFRDLLEGHRVRGLEISWPGDDQEPRWLSVSSSSLSDRYERPAAVVVVLQDVTERRRAEEQLRFSATHDSLTGLPNRVVFMDRLATAAAQAARRRARLGVFMIDLDRFKEVNDTLGHAVGDLLLERVAGRLLACVREVDTVSRLGGDEFAVILPEVTGPEAAEIVGERILASIGQPFGLEDREVAISCSVGIALLPQDGHRAEELLKHADLALYEAKEAGRSTLRFFSPDMATMNLERSEIERGLRVAVDRGEMALVYQPVVDLASGGIVAVEALLRWHHPRLGTLAPSRFLAIAESSGDMVEIGLWVLREACRQSLRWRHQGLGAVPVAVNVSAAELCRREFPDTVAAVLRETGLEPRLLEIELDERVLLEDIGLARSVLVALHDLGLRITVDEFDAGFAALSRLRSLPIDAVKISRLFVKDIEDPREGAVLMAMVAMAHNLGVEVVVEGVEKAEQLRYLRNQEWNLSLVARCDRAQGHLFSEPVGPDEIPGLFDRSDEIRRLTSSG